MPSPAPSPALLDSDPATSLASRLIHLNYSILCKQSRVTHLHVRSNYLVHGIDHDLLPFYNRFPLQSSPSTSSSSSSSSSSLHSLPSLDTLPPPVPPPSARVLTAVRRALLSRRSHHVRQPSLRLLKSYKPHLSSTPTPVRRALRSASLSTSTSSSSTATAGATTTPATKTPARGTAKLPSFPLHHDVFSTPVLDATSPLIPDPVQDLENFRAINPWTVSERALFLRMFARYGKDFRHIATYFTHKDTGDVVRFYFSVKHQYGLNNERKYEVIKKKRKVKKKVDNLMKCRARDVARVLVAGNENCVYEIAKLGVVSRSMRHNIFVHRPLDLMFTKCDVGNDNSNPQHCDNNNNNNSNNQNSNNITNRRRSNSNQHKGGGGFVPTTPSKRGNRRAHHRRNTHKNHYANKAAKSGDVAVIPPMRTSMVPVALRLISKTASEKSTRQPSVQKHLTTDNQKNNNNQLVSSVRRVLVTTTPTQHRPDDNITNSVDNVLLTNANTITKNLNLNNENHAFDSVVANHTNNNNNNITENGTKQSTLANVVVTDNNTTTTTDNNNNNNNNNHFIATPTFTHHNVNNVNNINSKPTPLPMLSSTTLLPENTIATTKMHHTDSAATETACAAAILADMNMKSVAPRPQVPTSSHAPLYTGSRSFIT